MRTPIIFSALLAMVVGCSTTQPIVTTQRVESVVKLSVYVGAKALIEDGKTTECQRALTGLRVLEASGERDIAAIAAALIEAGIKEVATAEGVLALGLAESLFTDAWGPEVVLGHSWATAVLRGAIGGLELALAAQTRAGPSVDMLARLEAAAAATRPRKP